VNVVCHRRPHAASYRIQTILASDKTPLKQEWFRVRIWLSKIAMKANAKLRTKCATLTDRDVTCAKQIPGARPKIRIKPPIAMGMTGIHWGFGVHIHRYQMHELEQIPRNMRFLRLRFGEPFLKKVVRSIALLSGLLTGKSFNSAWHDTCSLPSTKASFLP